MSISNRSGSNFVSFSFLGFLRSLVVSSLLSRFRFFSFSMVGSEAFEVSTVGVGSESFILLVFFSFLSFLVDLSFADSFLSFGGFTTSIRLKTFRGDPHLRDLYLRDAFTVFTANKSQVISIVVDHPGPSTRCPRRQTPVSSLLLYQTLFVIRFSSVVRFLPSLTMAWRSSGYLSLLFT